MTFLFEEEHNELTSTHLCPMSLGVATMNEARAARALNPIKNGITRPYYVNCQNNNTYVVKFAQNPEGPRVLVNEYICAEIATDLGLPLANPTLITIGQEFIEDHGDEIRSHLDTDETVQEGFHFGTEKVKKVVPITTAAMLAQARNVNVIPDIVIFDQLVCNVDRDKNIGNLLFDIDSKEIVVIDHTHAFKIGALWDASQLKHQMIGEPFEMFDTSGYVYKKLVQFIDGYNPFHSVIEKISGMTEERLWHIINSVPDQWLVTEEEKELLFKYLYDRKNRIEDVLPLLRNYLPRWKGGA